MTTANPTTIPGRMQCPYSSPDGIPSGEWATVDQLHSDAGYLAWTYEQHVAECQQLDLEPTARQTFELRRVEHAAHMTALLERVQLEVVRDARRQGATWEQIGSRLGTTRQAAQQRFGV